MDTAAPTFVIELLKVFSSLICDRDSDSILVHSFLVLYFLFNCMPVSHITYTVLAAT